MLSASRIIRIGETPYAHEREALRFIEGALPNTESFHVWELFELLDPSTGRLLEVDALVLGYSALYLVEIKSGPGKYEGNFNDWYRTPPGEPQRYMTPPLSFANTKAKILKSRLESRLPGQRIPRIEALVFLSAEDIELRFEQYGDLGVVTRATFAKAIQYHQYPGAPDNWQNHKIAAPLARDIAVTLRDKLGIRPRKGKLHVNEWQLGAVLHDTDTYQDREAEHRERPEWKARVRVYLVPQQTSVEHRQYVRRAADREAALLYELRDHPNILRTTGYATDAEIGPAVIFDHFEGEPLPSFLRKHADLSFDERVTIVEQVGRALAFCHQKQIAHGAVSPFAVLARRDPAQGIQTKLFNFQLGRRAGLQTTSHLTAFTEPPWRVYQAPEVDEEGTRDDEEARNSRGPSADLFGLGALAYFVFTGQHPAKTRGELLECLRRDRKLDPRTVNDGIPAEIADLIGEATASAALYRGDEVGDWVNLLLELATLPEAEAPQTAFVPPHEAKKGDKIAEDLEALGPLGQGATSRVLRVKRSDGRELALKCSLSEDHDQRLAAEGKVLAGLTHQNVVQLVEVRTIGARVCLLLTLAGSETMHQALTREGIVSLDYASRYGEELLLALEYLEEHGILHRDIKPANLGVGASSKEKKHLTLFDFSLAGASLKDIEVGTTAYREPFLRERGIWDSAADRWSAAVTIHELLTAARPAFPEGKTALDPDAEIKILAERFDPAVRTALAAFFVRAFKRSPQARFGSAREMRHAWLACFDEQRDLQGSGPVLGGAADAPEQAGAELSRAVLAAIGPETLVAALPLSARARTALDRAGVLHAQGLLTLPENALSAVRGVGRSVARGILEFRDAWKAARNLGPVAAEPFFPGYSGDDILVRTAKVPEPLAVALEDAGLRTLARIAAAPSAQVTAITERCGVQPSALRQYLESEQAPGATREHPATLPAWVQAFLPKKRERARYFELLFGLAAPFEGRLDVRSVEVAKALEVTRARVYQTLDAAREDWAKHGAVSDLRALAHATLEALGSTAPLREAALSFAQRVSLEPVGSDPLTVARAGALLRIVTEVERGDAGGLRLERLSGAASGDGNDVPWVTLGGGYRAALESLGALADELAAAPILSPGEVLRRLAETVSGSPLERVAPDRLAQLAASASQHAACSPRLELYPRGMTAERALTLASSVLGASMTAEDVQRLVAARYPDAEPLPPRPALDALLAPYQLYFSEASNKYLRPHERHNAHSTSFERPATVLATASTSQPRSMNAPAIAAREIDEQLNHAIDRRLLRILGVSVADAEEAAMRLSERKRLHRVRLDEALLTEMRALMLAKNIKDRAVHDADRLGPGSSGWPNLTTLARLASERVAQALQAPQNAPLLLTQPGLVARYELTDLLRVVVQASSAADAQAIFLLVPSHDHAGVPRLNGELPIPGVLPSQVLWITRDWLENRHNAAA